MTGILIFWALPWGSKRVIDGKVVCCNCSHGILAPPCALLFWIGSLKSVESPSVFWIKTKCPQSWSTSRPRSFSTNVKNRAVCSTSTSRSIPRLKTTWLQEWPSKFSCITAKVQAVKLSRYKDSKRINALMRNPLEGGRVGWFQRGYILLLFLHTPWRRNSFDHITQAYIMHLLTAFPVSMLIPCFWYNARLQQQTLSCITWVFLYIIASSYLLQPPQGYWFSIFYAHICHYISHFLQQYPRCCPIDGGFRAFLAILSWKVPFLMAYISNPVESMPSHSILIASLFIPELLDFGCTCLCCLFEALGMIYEKSWGY